MEEIAGAEDSVWRRLPEDFKEFLRVFGGGRFPRRYYGNIYGPKNFVHGCHEHLFLILGSHWATREQQRQFYVTRGAFNPAPRKYTSEALPFENINLLDLLQIGSDGGCCYHQVYVGERRPAPLGYCRLTPEKTMEDEAPSFSEGLKLILTDHWIDKQESEHGP